MKRLAQRPLSVHANLAQSRQLCRYGWWAARSQWRTYRRWATEPGGSKRNQERWSSEMEDHRLQMRAWAALRARATEE